MIVKMSHIIIFLIVFFGQLSLLAQESSEESGYNELKEMRDRLQKNDNLIESIWKIVIKTMEERSIPKEKKIEMLEKFINEFPENNQHLKNAELFITKLKEPGGRFKHTLNKDGYRTKPEWFALNFATGNFGFGGGFTLITLRGKKVFWEMVRIQATGYTRMVAANAKTMVGVPFFLDSLNRHELRLSTGFSGGYTAQWSGEKTEFDFDSGAHINIPFDLSYVFHVDRNFTFQIGVSADFPIWYYGKYIPAINGFIGFRL